MPEFTNPFSTAGTSSSTWKPSPHARHILRKVSYGPVGPRRVISKDERKELKAERTDSKIDSLDGQMDEDQAERYTYSFSALKDKFITDPRVLRGLASLDKDIENNFAPQACAATLNAIRDRRQLTSLRSLIVFIIALLIVFGALYSLVEYLLLVTRTSACSVSTVFIPVTYTVTAGMSNSSSVPLISPASGTNPAVPAIIYTSTSTETLTSYVTLNPAASSSKPPYVYTVDSSGSTHWVNGVSPTSGASLVTATTSVVIAEVPSESPNTAASTTPEPESLTFSPYTSTVYSYVEPDITLTSTSTSTNYVTYTLSSANAETRSSFTGIASGGWNASTSISPITGSASSSLNPESTTLTSIYYQTIGDQTTSTVTTVITTTISMRHTVTLTPSNNSPAFVTTITALPVTISDDRGAPSVVTDTVSSTVAAPSVLSSISTTRSGSTAEALTTSPGSPSDITPAIQSSSSTSLLLMTPAANLSSVHPYGSLPRPTSPRMGSTGFSLPTNSSATGSATGRRSSISSTLTLLPLSSSTGIPITSTMSGIPPPGSSESNIANSISTIISAGTRISFFSNSTTIVLNSSTTFSGVPSISAVPVASNSSNAGISETGGTIRTRPTLDSTSSLSPTDSSGATAGPISSSSVADTSGTVRTSPRPVPYTLTLTSSLSPGAPPPSTLNTSVRSSETVVSSNPAGASPVPRISTTPSAVVSNSSLASISSISTSKTNTSTSATASGLSQMSSSVSPSSISASNPFPASSATAEPTAGCGEHGDFMIDFDDLPNFMPTGQDQTDITRAPPIPNPYHHLTFSDGYVYAPQPTEPYTPESSPHLAVFLASASGKRVGMTPFGNYSKPGEISDGPRESISAFWFDAYSAFLGCDNPGPDACTLVLSAYTWSPTANTEVLAEKRNATIDPCPELKDCKLTQVGFPDTFRSLTGLQVQAFVGNEEKMFFMDDLALHWSNDTCAAGMLRQSSL